MGVGGVAEEKGEVFCPDDLVDQARYPREKEEEEDNATNHKVMLPEQRASC